MSWYGGFALSPALTAGSALGGAARPRGAMSKGLMAASDVIGLHASPKGLRHGFGVQAIRQEVPLNLVQRWLGHAVIATTTIYADVMGAEEREIAARMW